jgi:hypothetical protein
VSEGATLAINELLKLGEEELKAFVIGDGTNQTGYEVVFDESGELNHGKPKSAEQVFPLYTPLALLAARAVIHVLDSLAKEAKGDTASLAFHEDLVRRILGIKITFEGSASFVMSVRQVAPAAKPAAVTP